MTKISDKDYLKVMEEASKVFGADPAYFGKEGEDEVDRQLKKLGYDVDKIKGRR